MKIYVKQLKIHSTILALILLCPALFFNCASKKVKESLPPDAFSQNERLGKGGNIGNIHYRFDTWNKEREQQHFDLIKEIGLNSVRINTGPFAHVTETPPYRLSQAFFERLDWTINQALSRDLAVIIDNHEFRAMADDPMGNYEIFLSTWKQMAEHYKDYPDNVYFGILNEPHGHFTPYLWNYILADTIKVIRQSNPNRTLVIGPGGWNGINFLKSLELPEDDHNIIVEIHYYRPHRFTHQGVSWNEGSDAWLGTTWRGEPEKKQAITDDFKIAVDWEKQNNRPLFLGEFGVYKKADMESRVQWLKFVIQQAEQNNVAWALWDLMGTNFGIWDESKNSWIGPLKGAILQQE